MDRENLPSASASRSDSEQQGHVDDIPDDAVLVCAACGRTARHPHDFSDVSCTLNSVVCYEEKRDGLWIPYKQHPDTNQ